ncbi:RnfABCDGE type electron transport complex subunit D [Marinobacterium maritimum]
MPRSTQGIMATVTLAMLPGTWLYGLQYGPVVWLQVIWCLLLALLVEMGALYLCRKSLARGLSDLSWLVCALILARALPLMTPLWMMAIASVVALGLVKHANGGLGANRLNPAMAGLAVVAICFYQQLMPAPDLNTPWTLGLTAQEVLLHQLQLEPRYPVDIMTGATPLSGGALDEPAPLLSWIGYLGGGLLLAAMRVIRFEIPLAMITCSVSLCILAGHSAQESLHSLSLGGYVFTAFFIATDPVTSPDNRSARILFGATIGVVTELVREFGLYADGLCFAVLVANLLVPDLNRLGLRLHRPWHQAA